MAKILFLLLLSFGAYAQKLETFPFVLYGEKTVNPETHQIESDTKLYSHPSELLFTSKSLDVKTFNLIESLTVDYKISKQSFVFRNPTGELALVRILKVKNGQFPKQTALWLQFHNKSYVFLTKMK